MISASHNPYYDNGIKLIDCYGEKMDEETLLLVEGLPRRAPASFRPGLARAAFRQPRQDWLHGGLCGRPQPLHGLPDFLGIYSFRGVKVGLDCANGSSWNIAKSVFDALGADTYVINNKPNGLNINLNAGSTHIEGFAEVRR